MAWMGGALALSLLAAAAAGVLVVIAHDHDRLQERRAASAVLDDSGRRTGSWG